MWILLLSLNFFLPLNTIRKKYIIIIIQKIGNAMLAEAIGNTISQKTPAPQYQPIDWKKPLLLNLARPTPSNKGSPRSFDRDSDRG